MTAMAAGISDADLRAFSKQIGKLLLPPLAALLPANGEKIKRLATLAVRHRCETCHGDDYAEERQTPGLRIGARTTS